MKVSQNTILIGRMTADSIDKVERIIGIYTKLMNGAIVNKAAESLHYNVNEWSIQRDINDIRNYLDQKGGEDGVLNTVIYDWEVKGHRLEKLLDNCAPEANKKLVHDLISNEEFHYIESRHKSVFIDKMWEIGQAV